MYPDTTLPLTQDYNPDDPTASVTIAGASQDPGASDDYLCVYVWR